MAEHDPADVEFMARLLCRADNQISPDAVLPSGSPGWNHYKMDAIRALDWMQANGVKMTARDQCPQAGSVPPDLRAMMQWKGMHDAAPMTPREPNTPAQERPESAEVEDREIYGP